MPRLRPRTELDRLFADARRVGSTVETLVRQAFDAGVKSGLEQARAAIGKMAAPDAPPLVPSSPPPTPASGGYGEISNAVRQAMRDLRGEEGGVGPREVLDYLHLWPSTATIDIGQIRTALKVLAKGRELRRVKRGKYVPSPTLLNAPPTPDRAGGVVPSTS